MYKALCIIISFFETTTRDESKKHESARNDNRCFAPPNEVLQLPFPVDGAASCIQKLAYVCPKKCRTHTHAEEFY